MRTARAVPTPCDCRKTMMARTAFCCCQLSRMRWMRRGPMPLTSCRKDGLSSMTARVRSPKTSTILRAQVRADALDQPGAEVLLDALGGVRRRAAQLVGLELLAVLAVLHPGAGRLDVLAGRRRWPRSRPRSPGRAGRAPGRAAPQTRFGVVEGDALDDAGQVFRHDRPLYRECAESGCRQGADSVSVSSIGFYQSLRAGGRAGPAAAVSWGASIF